mmetsp:Transcript_5615/g.8499  ORF Transcript_5615/g.8499 Transcript_5615/m.8499 type:complete len:263 (-) Transcript_5615:26-814(-)|eukprot:CAMPEP_0201524330 /NCGR_PEP_ID=MMETSP0161_2-20130828/21256_1 /ASSEMBLY_ACC=CAM_ASM_000251 /TAXON_ID=180227 /ORGANISM="Neoparamoeba aestuarina, Strain SoJaBio B1-5/56/2" /LENGTH=262 /DNA_ID=CAMNT_0047923661 /DNA_START=120 /DNA_END=908 /DNA_ORIENTATION=+
MLMVEKFLGSLGATLRLVGSSVDCVGIAMQGEKAAVDTLNRHKRVTSAFGKPTISSLVFISPTASVSGEATIGSKSSLWYGAVVGGRTTRVGKGCVVGDNAVVKDSVLEDGVLVGGRAVVSNATLKSNSSIEMGSIISSGVIVEESAVVSAGSVVEENTVVKSGQLWAGAPAAYVRDLSVEEKESLVAAQDLWFQKAEKHANEHHKNDWEMYVENLEVEFGNDKLFQPRNPVLPHHGEPTGAFRNVEVSEVEKAAKLGKHME